jgi:hypothetical protein
MRLVRFDLAKLEKEGFTIKTILAVLLPKLLIDYKVKVNLPSYAHMLVPWLAECLHIYPFSILQVDEHPSSSIVLPSSQGRIYNLPSPQI